MQAALWAMLSPPPLSVSPRLHYTVAWDAPCRTASDAHVRTVNAGARGMVQTSLLVRHCHISPAGI